MENVARTAGAVEATQVVVAVVVTGGCLSWGYLALIDVWEGWTRQAVSREGDGAMLGSWLT